MYNGQPFVPINHPVTALTLKAQAVPYTEWDTIYSLMEETNDPAEKEALRVILIEKYHQEEGWDI